MLVDIVGNIIQVVQNDAGLTLTVVKEFSFETLQQCWDAATLFNGQAQGTGYVMMCWPMPVEALGVLK